MSNFNKILNGKCIYPLVNNNYFIIKYSIDMRSNYKRIFKTNVEYNDFLKRVKFDDIYRYFIVNELKEYIGLKNIKIITDVTYNKWYFVELKKPLLKKYTIKYVYKIGMLNSYKIFETYIDFFQNKIKFSC